MFKDKWMAGFGLGAVILVVVAIISVFATRGRTAVTYPPDSPVGVVQKYLLMLGEGRSVEAESLLTEPARQRRHEGGMSSGIQYGTDLTRRIVLVSERVDEPNATVVVDVTTFQRSGPASTSSWRNRVSFELQQESGVWRIASPDFLPF